MSEITKNPNLKKIDRFVSYYKWHIEKGPNTYDMQYQGALVGCDIERRERGIPDIGKCILVEYRYGDEFRILIKPKLEAAADEI